MECLNKFLMAYKPFYCCTEALLRSLYIKSARYQPVIDTREDYARF